MAVFRLFCAGLIPIFILWDVMNLTGPWAFSTFGFITLVMIPIPFILFFLGPTLRARSKFSRPSASEEKAMAMMMEGRGKHMSTESPQA